MSDQLTKLKAQLLSGSWVCTISEAAKYSDKVLGFRNIDTRERFHNRFFHEFCPLLAIAVHTGNTNTRIAFTASNTGIDGHILFGPDQRQQDIELTAAIDGESDALRMELLQKCGHAPAFGKIDASGTRGKGRVFGPNDNYGGLADEYDQNILLPLLRSALAAKQKKAATRPNYHEAWLGIVFDDYPLGDRAMRKRRFDPVCKEFLGTDPRNYAPFGRVFCVGIQREYLFDSASIAQNGDT